MEEATSRQTQTLCTVLTVRGILAHEADKYINARVELEDLAMDALSYVLNPEYDPETLSEDDRYSLSDDYKRTVPFHLCRLTSLLYGWMTL